MFRKSKNYLILKNAETPEEHLGRIVDIDKHSRKLRLELVDENKNRYYRRDKEIEILVPMEKDLYSFKSNVIFYDVIDKIITVEYPEEINTIIRRKYKRFDLQLALDIQFHEHIIPSISYDLGLGGIAFLVHPHFELENTVKIKIKSDLLQDIFYDVKIVNKKVFRYNGNDYFLYAGEFCELEGERFDKLLIFFSDKENRKLVEKIQEI